MAEGQNQFFLTETESGWDMTEETPNHEVVQTWTCQEHEYQEQIDPPTPPMSLVRGGREFIDGRWHAILWPYGTEPLEPPIVPNKRQWVRTPQEL